VGPRTVELQIERRARRAFPVAVALARSGPAAAAMNIQLSPEAVFVSGPARAIAALDTVWLSSPRVDARKDSVRVELSPEALPDWCAMEPATVSALITIPRRSR
jgi:hypothetical protein